MTDYEPDFEQLAEDRRINIAGGWRNPDEAAREAEAREQRRWDRYAEDVEWGEGRRSA